MDSITPTEQKPMADVPPPPSVRNFSAAGSGMPVGHSQSNSYRLIIIIGSVLLALAILAWIGLQIYQRSINNRINDIRLQVANTFSQAQKDQAAQIIDVGNRAQALEGFLNSHVYTSRILSSIAAATLPKVKWDSYELSLKDQSVSLKGQAANYAVVAQQLSVFNEVKFSDTNATGIALNKNGNIDFSVSFKFDKKLLQNK